ncbi:MAG: prepilin peptidase [Lentisphaeria bacterium]
MPYQEIEFGSQAYYFLAVLTFVFGTMIGSFLNVVVWRMPRGMSLSTPGSHCPKCGHVIPPWENIPILSWLFLRGRCSSCHTSISWRYPFGESMVGVLFLLVFLHVFQSGLNLWVLLGSFWLTGLAFAVALIDLEFRKIPNKLIYSSLIFGGLLLFFPEVRAIWLSDWVEDKLYGTIVLLSVQVLLLAFFAGLSFLPYFRKRSCIPFGLGDVKYQAVMIVFLGVRRGFDVLLLGAVGGFVLGGLWQMIQLARGRSKGDGSVAFGVFLSIAAYIRLFL